MRPGAMKRARLSISVIVGEAFVEPEDFLDAERALQGSFGFCFVPIGVAIWIEQALAGGDERALPVHFDSAAFEDEIVPGEFNAGGARDLIGDFRVVRQLILAAPTVKAETDTASARKDRTGVSKPDVAERAGDDLRALRQSKLGAGFSFAAVRKHPHAITLPAIGERADHGGNFEACGFQVFTPEVGGGRPCGPDRLVGRPFCGNHAHRRTSSACK
jgi:hypothetical protein